MSQPIEKGDVIASMQRTYGLRGAPPFALEQSILPVHIAQDQLSPFPPFRPFEYQVIVGAVAAQYSYFLIWLPETLAGDQRTVVEEIWTYTTAGLFRFVWDLQSYRPFNNTETLLPDMGFGEYPDFAKTTSSSLTGNYFVPVVRDVTQSATDYLINGRDIPAQQNTWTRIPTYLILRPGMCWIVRPDAVNSLMSVRVRGRHYA